MEIHWLKNSSFVLLLLLEGYVKMDIYLVKSAAFFKNLFTGFVGSSPPASLQLAI